MDINRGGRPKKLQIEINEEGLREILQRAYIETEDIRQKSLMVFNKAIRKMKETNDIALIGKTTAEYLKIAGTATTNKMQIAKMVQDQILKAKALEGEGSESVGGGFVITDDIKDEIASLQSDIQKQMKKLPEGGEMIDVDKALDEIENKELKKIKKNGE